MFDTDIKNVKENNLIISIMFIISLSMVNLLSLFPVLARSTYFLKKWCKFYYCVIFGDVWTI